jgi:hypothetical protein
MGASLGVCLVVPDASFVEVTRTADAMMYEAERSGKDQHRFAVIETDTRAPRIAYVLPAFLGLRI